MKAQLWIKDIERIVNSRNTPEHRAVTHKVFMEAKAHYGIPPSHRLKAECDDVKSPFYGILIRKKTGETYGVHYSLVEQYPFFYRFIPTRDALGLLKAAAEKHGLRKPMGKDAPAWEGVRYVDNWLAVPTPKGCRGLQMEYALAALSTAGKPTTSEVPPSGAGGILAVAGGLLVPA